MIQRTPRPTAAESIQFPRRVFLLSGLFVGLLILLGATSRLGATGDEKPDPRFGVSEAFWSPEDARELGVGWERILFYWKEIQPGGPEDWNTLHVLEEWLVEAEQSGREVIGLLKNTPRWASEDGTEAGLPTGLYLDFDDPENYWANYTRRIAQYYSSRNVHHWIIWNEPEISSDTYGYEFAGSPEDYYRLLKVAYTVMKEEDPQAVIHLAGVTWWHDPTFLSRLFDIMAEDPEAESNDWFFDVVSLHIYFRPETALNIVQEIGSLLEEYELDKKIWVNETNAPPNMDPLWPVERPAFDVDLEQQAWFIIQTSALAFSGGAERLAVYKLIDVMLPEGGESFGLVRQDGSQRPAFEAYEAVIDHLGFFQETSLKTHPHYYAASFYGTEKLVRVAWARGLQPVILSVPSAADRATLVNYLGDAAVINSEDGQYLLRLDPAVCHQECLIGGPPLILVEERRDVDPEQVGTAAAAAGTDPTPVTFITATRYATATPTPTPIATDTSTPTATPLPTETVPPTEVMVTESSPTAVPVETSTPQSSALTPDETREMVNTSLTEIPGDRESEGEPSDSAVEGEDENMLGLIVLASALITGAALAVYWIRSRPSR